MKRIIAALAALSVSGCSASQPRAPDTTQTAESPYVAMHSSLCSTLIAARRGDLIEARKTFIDDSHTALHALANDVAKIDRAVSARLLEAKQRVEADFSTLEPAAAIDIDQLVNRVETAIAALGDAPPPPCATEGST